MSLLGAATGCAAASSPVAVPGAGETTITRGTLRAIETRWQRVELGYPLSATCGGQTDAPAALSRGDFNGDGAEDTVLWIAAGGTPHLVAAIARLDGTASVFEVGDGAAFDGPTAVEVGRRGAAYRPADLTIDSFYGADTIVTRGCDGTRTAWFWTGESFQSQLLAKAN